MKIVILILVLTIPSLIFATDPLSEPLLHSGDFTFFNYFSLPDDFHFNSGAIWAGISMVYYAPHNSLFMPNYLRNPDSGNSNSGDGMSEMAIPDFNNGNKNSTYIQNPVDATEGQYMSVQPGGANFSGIETGGVWIKNGKLYFNLFGFYDGGGSQAVAMFRRPINLSDTGHVEGPFGSITQASGHWDGPFTDIPPEWQSLMGGDVLISNCCLSVVTRTSAGPNAYAFNSSNFGANFPLNTLADIDCNPDVNGNCQGLVIGGEDVTYDGSVRTFGMTWIPNTRTVVYFVRRGSGPTCYGGGATTLPPYDTGGVLTGTNASTSSDGLTVFIPNADWGGGTLPGDAIIAIDGETQPDFIYQPGPVHYYGANGITGSGGSGTAGAYITVSHPYVGNLANKTYSVGPIICYDPSNNQAGFHSYPYLPYLWLYDAADFYNAYHSGTPTVGSIHAYEKIDLSPQIGDAGNGLMSGGAYDPVNKYLYYKATVGRDIYVFSVNAPNSTPASPLGISIKGSSKVTGHASFN